MIHEQMGRGFACSTKSELEQAGESAAEKMVMLVWGGGHRVTQVKVLAGLCSPRTEAASTSRPQPLAISPAAHRVLRAGGDAPVRSPQCRAPAKESTTGAEPRDVLTGA